MLPGVGNGVGGLRGVGVGWDPEEGRPRHLCWFCLVVQQNFKTVHYHTSEYSVQAQLQIPPGVHLKSLRRSFFQLWELGSAYAWRSGSSSLPQFSSVANREATPTGTLEAKIIYFHPWKLPWWFVPLHPEKKTEGWRLTQKVLGLPFLLNCYMSGKLWLRDSH